MLRAGVTRTWLVLGGLGVVLLLLALLVADRLARSLTRPVTDLAATAHRLGSGDLTARATPAGPAEVREVATAVNRLAGRIGELLTAEREAAADLAHRLRTPAHRAAPRRRGPPAGDRERLLDDVDAVGRGIDEVISEARRPLREGLGAGCDAAAVVGDRVALLVACWPRTEGRAVTVDLPAQPLPSASPPADLGAAVDALLGNVFAHTPDGTAFGVAVRPRDGRRRRGDGVRRRARHRPRAASSAGAAGAGRPASAWTSPAAPPRPAAAALRIEDVAGREPR